tara:strand:+ start:3593 stop:5077 length:1485 start_codon:yes stop_codon:yes gene_type:complete
MSNLDLDIIKYTDDELVKLLKLSKDYNLENLSTSIELIKKKILNSANLNENKKIELDIFIDNINNRLINSYNAIHDSGYNNVKQFDENHFIIKNQNIGKTILENNQTIDKTIIKKTYNIDSIFRENYGAKDNQSNEYIIELPETINKAVTMSISSIEIPLSYHNISPAYNNNYFEIHRIKRVGGKIDDASSCRFCISLVPGTYTTNNYRGSNFNTLTTQSVNTDQPRNDKIAFDIQKAVNESLQNTQLVGYNYEDISNNLDNYGFIDGFKNFLNENNDNDSVNIYQHDSDEDKIVFSIKYFIDRRTGFSYFSLIGQEESGISYELDFDVFNHETRNNKYCNDYPELFYQNEWFQRLGWMLGYRIKSQTLNYNNGDEINNLSIAPCHINYPRYLYVCIDDFQSNSKNYFSIAARSVIAPNIIARINILSILESKNAFMTGAAPVDYRHDQKHIREYFGPTNIKKLKVKLIDEYGRTFSLNYMDWSFLLTFECYYN